MNATLQAWLKNGPLVTDGSWGAQMQLRGLEPGALPDLWNLERPDAVVDLARAYVEAGSRIILTNTFGACRLNLERYGLCDRAIEINREGARLSRQAAEERAWVFASIGPSGKMLVMNQTTPDELRDAFMEQAAALAEGGAHALVIETMSDLDEARIAAQAACATGLPVVACMTFDSGKNKDRTMMGVTPEQAAETLAEAGASAIGANCGQGIEGYPPIVERLLAAGGLPVWAKANAGSPRLAEGQATYESDPDSFAQGAMRLIEAGASFIGGCCGTGPEHIQAICRELKASVRPS